MPEFAVNQTAVAPPDTLEVSGQWWTASNLGRTTGGTLRLGQREGSLEVNGSLIDDFDDSGPVTILGTSTKGEAFTIPVAHPTSIRESGHRSSPNHVMTQTFICFSVLRGEHFEEGDDQSYECVSFTGPAVGQWIRKRLAHDDRATVGTRTIKIDVPEPITTRLPDGILTLAWHESNSFGLNVTVRLAPTFVWRPDTPARLEDAVRMIGQPIEFFLTLATGQLVDLDRVDVMTTDALSNSHRSAQVVSARLFGAERRFEARHGEYLIPYDQVEGDLMEVLGRWIEITRASRSAMVQYFSGALSRHAFLEEQFLSTVRALEIWHRKVVGGTVMPEGDFEALKATVRGAVSPSDWAFLSSRLQHAAEPSLKQRLDAMIDEAGEPVAELFDSFRRFTRRVVDTRNTFTHLGTQEERPFDELELVYAQKACAVLFEMTALRHAGLGAIATARLPRTEGWKWLTGDNNPLRQS